jgi:hypothetical protein
MTAVPITYAYKTYRNGVYLGDLPNVSSQFNYALDINNGSAPLTIECDVPVTRASESISTIDTELGIALQAEDGTNLEIERQPDLYGISGGGTIIANDNVVVVYEFSPDYPSGKIVWSGWITKWNISARAGRITINCISYGMDLNDYLIQGALTQDQSQTSQNTSLSLFTWAKSGEQYSIGQQFTTGAAVPNLAAVTLWLAVNSSAVTLQLDIWNSASDANTGVGSLGSTLLTISNTTAAACLFQFTTAISLLSNTQYFFTVKSVSNGGGGALVYLYNLDSTHYTGGNALRQYFSGTTGDFYYRGAPWNDFTADGDLYFKTWYTANATSSPYTSVDPTAIFTSIIDNYVARGGKVNYTAASIANTGSTVSYTFSVQRVLDGIGKALDLSPSNWYWTVDPATSLAYFKSFSTTADILLTLGQNIEDLDLGVSAEGVRNVLYFTGGPTAGVNLYKSYQSASSITAVGRQRLETMTDNRVTLSATADAIANAFLSAYNTEVYETTVTLARTVIDITTILPGQTVGFSGFGNFIDALILRVMRVQRFPDRVTLTLGSIPPRASSVLKNIIAHVVDLETVANPTAPS